MPAPLEKTRTPGVYKRGKVYVVVYRDPDGRQRQESARTFDDARRLRARRVSDVDAGEHRVPSTVTFAEYARGWIERHQGSGRGFRESTRAEYRRDLERYVIPFLGAKRLTALRSSDQTSRRSSPGWSTTTRRSNATGWSPGPGVVPGARRCACRARCVMRPSRGSSRCSPAA